jgi:hypothetical protein
MLNELDRVRITRAAEHGARRARRAKDRHPWRHWQTWKAERDDVPATEADRRAACLPGGVKNRGWPGFPAHD